MTIDQLIEYNFGPFIGLIFQIMILLLSKSFTKVERRVFIITVVLEVLEIFSYNFEFYFSELSTPSMWRVFFSVMGYIVRPALVYPFIYLLRCETKFKDNKWFFLDLIPLAVVFVIQMFAFGTDWVFSYDSTNHFHRGPLGYISMIVTIVYLVEASLNVILAKVFDHKVGISLIILVLVYVVLAMTFESIYDIRSLGISAAVFSIVYFMFALQTNHLDSATRELKALSETDSLSQLSNRYYGEKMIDEALANKKAGLFAIIDLDDFKTINDTYGHMAGDEAIVKVAKVLKENLAKDDVVMRLGGDEFAVYSTHVHSKEEAEQSVQTLFGIVNKIQLEGVGDKFVICASVGVAYYDGTSISSFDSLYHEADKKLYEAKNKDGNAICY